MGIQKVKKNTFNLFKLLQFNFILKIGICWNVIVHTAHGSIRVSGFDFQQRLLSFLELLDGLVDAINNAGLGRFTDHKVDISLLKYTVLVPADDVN